MATRDEVIRFVYTTTGDKDLAATADLLVRNADAGKLVDEESIRLAASLKTVAAQAKAVNEALSEKAALADTASKFEAAQKKAAALAETLERTSASAKEVNKANAASEAELARLTAQYARQDLALQKSLGSLQKAGIDTNDLAAANAKLSASATVTATALKTYSDGLGKTNAQQSQAVSGFEKLRNSLAGLAAGYFGLQKLKDGFLEILKTGDKFELLGKRFEVVFGSIDAGAAAFSKIKDIAKATPLTLDEVANAAVKLKAFGLDPLNGSLIGLIDQNAKLGGSNEDLQNTILALGQAWTKQKLQGDDIRQLLEKGIPVYDLLAQATGKTAKEIQRLSEAGELGRESITQLITQIGKAAAGGAAAQMKTLTGLVSNLKDNFDEFLVRIANAGALDFFKSKLTDLGDAITALTASGKLQDIAASISNGIVSSARGVQAAVGFVVQYSGALLELGKAYLVIKAINIAGSVLQGATAMQAAATAALAATAATAETTGAFGKLAAAAKSIPRSIALAVSAIGIEFTLTQLSNLVAIRREEIATNRLGLEADRERDSTLANLATRIAAVKAQYAAYASVAIESGDKLRTQNAEQLKAYGDQLDGAKRYYSALVVEARTAGDAVGLKGAKEKLAAVTTEITAVNAQLAVTKTIGGDAAAGLTVGATKIVTQLSEVKASAKDTGDLLKKAFEAFDLRKPTDQVGDFALGFDAVAAKGGKAAETLNSTLLETLKDLSGPQLLNFQSSAVAAMGAVGDAGEKTSATLKATLETALDRLGVKAETTGQRITKSGADTIATFTAVAENAQANAKTIAASFDAALDSAKTVDEAKALGAALQAAADTGKISFKQLAASSTELDERIRTLTANISPLASQFELLGIKSQSQLNAVRDNAKEAFDAIVTGARAGTAAQEDVVRAFKAYVDAQRAAVADSSQSAKDQVEEQLALQASVYGVADAFVQAGSAGKAAGDKAAEGFGNAKDQINEAGAAAGQFAGNVASASIATDRIGESAKQSAAAFTSGFSGVVAQTEASSRALKDLNEILERSGSVADVSLEQAKSLLANLGAYAGSQAQALSQRIQELEQVAAQAQQTAINMANEAASLQDQIDQLQGNQADIEERRHARALENIRSEADAAGVTGSAEYTNLVNLENQLHDLKVSNQRKESAQSKAAADAAAQAPTATGSTAPSKTTVVEHVQNVPDLNIGGKRLSAFTDGDVIDLAKRIAGNQAAAAALVNSFLRAIQTARSASGAG